MLMIFSSRVGVNKQNAEKEQLKLQKREPGARAKKAEAAAAASGGLESGESQMRLIERPKDYAVAFSFPEVVHLSPPIMEVRDVDFRYSPTLPWLFKGLNFGLDMNSRGAYHSSDLIVRTTMRATVVVDLVHSPRHILYDSVHRRSEWKRQEHHHQADHWGTSAQGGRGGEAEPEVSSLIVYLSRSDMAYQFYQHLALLRSRLRVGVYNQHFVERLPMEEDPVTYLRRLFNEETYQTG